MASNTRTIRDGDVDDPKDGSKGGAYSDWIEIWINRFNNQFAALKIGIYFIRRYRNTIGMFFVFARDISDIVNSYG